MCKTCTFNLYVSKSGPQNHIFMKQCRHFLAQRGQNHYNFLSNLTSRNSSGTSGTLPETVGKVQLAVPLHHAPGARITVVLTNSLKLYHINVLFFSSRIVILYALQNCYLYFLIYFRCQFFIRQLIDKYILQL